MTTGAYTFPIIGDCIVHSEYHMLSDHGKLKNYISGGHLLTLGTTASLVSPFAIIMTDIPSCNDISITAERIRMGNRDIPASYFKKYDSTLGAASIKRCTSSNIISSCYKPGLFPPKSLSFLIDRSMISHFTSTVEKAYVSQAVTAYEFMLDGNYLRGVNGMKGIGPGLTPSGDDFNAGVLAGIYVNELISGTRTAALRQMLADAAEGKNPISNAMIRCLSSGHFPLYFKEFILTLGGDDKEIHRTVARLLDYGSTSGADLLTGFLLSVKNKFGL